MMGDLPTARVTASTRPFVQTVVDYCGPFLIKEGSNRSRKFVKTSVAIFVCLSTKAVHIEVVTDLTSEAFVAALHRFVSRRGLSTDMYSDNGTNFVGADSELNKLIALLKGDEPQAIMTEKGIKWHFIPPRAPHFGGLWEAAVKSMKHHFRRVADDAKLNYMQFQTLLCQIEAVLNSRPLCPLSSDPNDDMALTPGHFIIGDALMGIPEPSLMHLPENRLSKWQIIQSLKHHFWKRWHKEYLNEYQQRSKWKTSTQPQIQVGQIVIVRDESTSPGQWSIGRVIEVHPCKDQIVRAATVRVGKTFFRRRANKLCVLPLDD